MSQVSICITTYNRGKTLPATLESILNQSFSDFELIISDDNSQDETADVCLAYCKQDSRIRYYRNERNLKMPGNLNNAISKAKFDFIANLHDGDIYRHDLIEKWYIVLKRNPNALFVFNNYNSLDSSGKKLRTYEYPFNELNNGRALIEYSLKTLTSGPWGTVMARKAAYEKYGCFDSNYGFISDVEMWLRLGLNGLFCYVNEPLIDLSPRERNHPYYLPHWKIFCLNIAIIIKYYKLFGAKSPDLYLQFPWQQVCNQISRQALMDMLVLFKHSDYTRIREGLYVLKQLPVDEIHRKLWFLYPFRSKPVSYQEEMLRLIDILKK